jgi:anti-anti-sigma factor
MQNADYLQPLTRSSFGFSSRGRRDDDAIVLHLEGEGNIEALPALEEALTALHECMLSGSTKMARVDLTQLGFLSSSGLQLLVAWLDRVRSAPTPYRIVFTTGSHSWQRRSMTALRCCAPELVAVEAWVGKT